MKRVSKDGVITVEEPKAANTYVDEVIGMQFDRGYLSPYFITNTEKWLRITTIRIYSDHGQKDQQYAGDRTGIEKVVSAYRPILIIAEDVDSQALGVL